MGHEELVRDGGVGTRNEVTLDSLIGLSWTRAWKMKLQRPFLFQYEDFDKDFSHDGAVFVSIDPDLRENFSTLHFTMLRFGSHFAESCRPEGVLAPERLRCAQVP